MTSYQAVEPHTQDPFGGLAKPYLFTDLTPTQKQKFSYLRSIYDEEKTILHLISLLESKGENGWKKVNDKLDSILQGDYKTQQYDDAIYDCFQIGRNYASDDIIANIGGVRRDLGLSPYISSIKRNCEHDFFKLFMVQTIDLRDAEQVEANAKKMIVYKPVFKLKPQD